MDTVDTHTNTTRGYVVVDGLNPDQQVQGSSFVQLEEAFARGRRSPVMQAIDTKKAQADLNRAWGKIQEAARDLSDSKTSLNSHRDPEAMGLDGLGEPAAAAPAEGVLESGAASKSAAADLSDLDVDKIAEGSSSVDDDLAALGI